MNLVINAKPTRRTSLLRSIWFTHSQPEQVLASRRGRRRARGGGQVDGVESVDADLPRGRSALWALGLAGESGDLRSCQLQAVIVATIEGCQEGVHEVERLKFLRRTAHVVSILAPLLLVACSSASPRQEQSEKANSQPDSAQTLVDETGTQIATSAPPQTTDPKSKPSERDKWIYDALRPSVLANIALVGCAIWAGCIALRTLKAIRREVHETAKAANAAKVSARIANDSLTHTKNSERAWIGVEDIALSPLVSGQRLHAHAIFKNYGKSVALQTKVLMMLDASPRILSEPEIFLNDREAEAELSVIYNARPVFPSGTIPMEIYSNDPPTDSDIAMYSHNRAWIYIHGKATYIDVYGTAHETWFCAFCDVAGGKHQTMPTPFKNDVT